VCHRGARTHAVTGGVITATRVPKSIEAQPVNMQRNSEIFLSPCVQVVCSVVRHGALPHLIALVTGRPLCTHMNRATSPARATVQVLQADIDLLHPPAELEKRSHKLKRLVQSPNSFFMDVKCQGCFQMCVATILLRMHDFLRAVL
jgi:hypothetical protein